MQELAYTALEKVAVPNPVDRIDYICANASDKYVLDLGALDETAYQAKQDTEYWLHKRIAQVANFVRGVDNSELVKDGLSPCDNSLIQAGDVHELKPIIEEHGVPDLIVAGELIEHVPNSLAFLQSIKAIDELQGCRFIFTTPNACSLHNFIIGLFKRESTHIDHLTILSYKTINTLCRRAGFQSWKCYPYYMKFPEMINNTQGFARWSTITFEKTVNIGERLFPLVSGGWVVDIVI